MPILIILLPILLILVWVVTTYNFFVSSKARIKAAVQEIGNQLKRQSDLIPNLEASVKGYMKQEKGIFVNLTEARKAVAAAVKSGDLQKMSDAGTKLSNVLPDIKVIVEDNPELKSNEVIAKLMDELRDTSDKVMYSRRLVIDLTADFNVKRVSFPSSLIANIFKFGELPGLITSEEDTKTPKVNL